MERRPGASKLVYDKKSRTIKKVTINRWARLCWYFKSLFLLLVLLLCGCTTMKATIAPDKTVTLNYKYLLQNKTWTVIMPDGSKIDFNNTNQAITDLASAVNTLADKMPVTPMP